MATSTTSQICYTWFMFGIYVIKPCEENTWNASQVCREQHGPGHIEHYHPGLPHRHMLGLRVERRHHLQSVCLQDVVLVDQIDENRLGLSLVGQCYSIHLTAQT
ncbi:hypothetical protein AVEN_203483-1 [Araneus ventricosus]|uniref:Uncharacterized protein n=1 Tax=Araneus ventricosus TaxID=182803 RepID=A0A4Y2BGF2_ARAVE|nr:hypothetical protein AVEN_203483-1 [Araneus ventricosus]